MAEKLLERTYTIPLRSEWLKAPRYKRANKAVKALRQFMMRHMKSEDVIIGHFLNEALWERGIRSPPHKVKVHTRKLADGKVLVELEGKPLPEVAKKEEKKKKSKLAETVEKMTGGAKKAKKATKEEKKEEVKTEVKEEPKVEVKEEEPKVEVKEEPKVEKKPEPAKPASAKTNSVEEKKPEQEAETKAAPKPDPLVN